MLNAAGPVSPFDAQRAETYLRLRADAELSEAMSRARGHADDDLLEIGRKNMARVGALAGALSAVGAVPEPVAASVIADLGDALVSRHLLPSADLDTELVLPGPSPRPVSLRAVPAGVTAECAVEGFGYPVRIRFGALVTDGQSARITWRAAFTDPALTGPRAPFLGPEPSTALRNVPAADDLGGRHRVASSLTHGRFGSGGRFRWEGWCRLEPAPSAAARWLELTLAGNRPVRISLDHPRVEQAAIVTALDPATAAERYVDAGSVALLADDPVRPPGVVAMAVDLLAAGVLQPDSPSLARLAAVARRQGLPLPEPLGSVEPALLPAEWAGLLDRIGTDNGASGVVFAAAVLPEVEGVRCVITELASRPDISTFRVYARAWPYSYSGYHGLPQHDDRYHWDVRDNLGARYATSAWTGAGTGGEAEFPLRLRPPVSPRARELQITLMGRTSQASVSVPLDWQHDNWESDQMDWQAES